MTIGYKTACNKYCLNQSYCKVTMSRHEQQVTRYIILPVKVERGNFTVGQFKSLKPVINCV